MQTSRALLSSLSVPVRIAALLVFILMLAGCKAEIYQGLSEEQANTILSVLLRHGISAEKTSAKGGHSIAVEESQIVQSLEILRENSLPREEFQNLGKVFSAQGMISSNTEEQARLAYALSQELSDTFSRIDGVLTARVHVVLSQTDTATGSITPPSAAVFLRHTPESQVTRLVSNIRELTANAVPGLAQDRVSVMLVPVRETVTVPMPQQQETISEKRMYILAGLAALLLLAVSGLGMAMFVRSRREKSSK